MRRETADAEQRAAQLEMELQRLTTAQKEREDDLERRMDALNRQHPCHSAFAMFSGRLADARVSA